MRGHPTDRQPTSWLLYGMGAMLVGVVGLIEASVASGAVRLFLELGTVVSISLLVLVWLRANRVRIALAELGLTIKQNDGEVRGGDSLISDKPTQPKPAQPSGGQPKPGQPQPSTPKK